MLGNKKASSFRGVRSEPTPAPIKAKPAEQKYHDEDDQYCIHVHGSSSPKFFGRGLRFIFRVGLTGLNIAGKLMPS